MSARVLLEWSHVEEAGSWSGIKVAFPVNLKEKMSHATMLDLLADAVEVTGSLGANVGFQLVQQSLLTMLPFCRWQDGQHGHGAHGPQH